MKIRLAALSTVAVALALSGTAFAGSAAAAATTVRVTAKDFAFVLSTKSVPYGRVTFRIRNVSPAPHDFWIDGHKSKTIGKGQSTTLTVTLKRGVYPYRCTVDHHAELGMKGVLRVR